MKPTSDTILPRQIRQPLKTSTFKMPLSKVLATELPIVTLLRLKNYLDYKSFVRIKIMKIRSITITNFRGISDATTVSFNDFCCIVGKNDAGKRKRRIC